MSNNLSSGTVHTLPADLKKALLSKPKAVAVWKNITPLARNEWICWVTSVKREDTRADHVRRVPEELIGGKRRPCCWIGCIHRSDKPMSKAVKYLMSKKK